PDDGDKVVASDEGGEIAESDETRTEELREDSGTVVGAMQSSDAVRSEQAVAVGGVKAMPAVRAMARKLKVDLSQVKPTGAEGVIPRAAVKQAAASGTAKAGTAPATSATTARPA